MVENRGKQFEQVVKESFLKVPEVSIDRMHDQMNGYLGSRNSSDFIVYKKPYEYYIECKSVHGNLLPFHNITHNQWTALQEKSKIPGVFAGIMCWWIDRDVTKFVPIQYLVDMASEGNLSIRYDTTSDHPYEPFIIEGKKKRVFFDYDMDSFFKEFENE